MSAEKSQGLLTDLEPLNTRVYERLQTQAVYLTFDDGPNSEVTPPLLDLLEQRGAQATFFVSGTSLLSTRETAVLRMIRARGHTLANHGFIHDRNGCPMFDRMHDEILELCGVSTKLIRAPYGHLPKLTSYLSAESDAVAFHWTLEFRDFEPVNFDRARSLLSEIVRGSIILLHDGIAPTSIFKDRHQVLELTRLILDYCDQRAFSVRGLKSEFPHAYSDKT